MSEHQVIECSTLQRINPLLEALTARINAAGEPAEKIRLAGELQQEVDAFLDCPNHQASRLECRNCRLIATLRHQATELVRGTGRLSAFQGRMGP